MEHGTNGSEMKEFVERFLASYRQRDPGEDFAVWLSRRIAEELPGLSGAESEALAGQIMAGVAQYDRTLAEVNRAAAAGTPREEWLADKLTDACAALPPEEAGPKLQQMESALAASNAALMGEAAPASEQAGQAAETAWNEYSLKAKAKEIAEQASVVGLAVSAEVVRQHCADGASPQADGKG